MSRLPTTPAAALPPAKPANGTAPTTPVASAKPRQTLDEFVAKWQTEFFGIAFDALSERLQGNPAGMKLEHLRKRIIAALESIHKSQGQ